MKKTISIALSVITLSVLLMSCNKEYNCECDGFSVIVEAASTGEAETECKTKGTNCSVK